LGGVRPEQKKQGKIQQVSSAVKPVSKAVLAFIAKANQALSDEIQSKKEPEAKASSLIELPTDIPEPIGLSDAQIMRTFLHDNPKAKPRGSAYVLIQMALNHEGPMKFTKACIDTGADLTLCTDTFLKINFGNDACKSVVPMKNPPKLRSASGHQLNILGIVHMYMRLGTYELRTRVVVQENKAIVFLLGSDVFYDRLIFDRGKYLMFSDKDHPPIPIMYELEKKVIRVEKVAYIAPHSNAILMVKITNDPHLYGKEIVIRPDNEWRPSNRRSTPFNDIMTSPVTSTVSKIGPDGRSIMLIENRTDDILTILPETELGFVDILSESGEPTEDKAIYSVVQEPIIECEKPKVWPETALSKSFIARLPPNVHLRSDIINLPDGNINYVHDKDERRQLLDGTGNGFPTPPSFEPPTNPTGKDPEEWLQNIEHAHLSDDQWAKLKAILLKYKDAFSKSKKEVGCCTYFKAELPLKPGTGYLYNKPRPLPFKHREIAAETISDLLEQGIIRPSKSPHATNIVVVKKKALNGVTQHRVCVDLRQVNEHSVPNRFPNFQMEDAMAKIQGSVLRTSFDFANAFHQIMLTEDSIPVTAVYFNNMLYEYVRVPFGHVCAMSIYCCVMALLCEKYPPASYYADDLMVLTKNDPSKNADHLFDQHLQDIVGMLERIILAGLKLKAHKCQWCFDSSRPMEWLGFTLENNLLKPQEAKVKSIREFPVPTSSKQAISFVSLASFYRRFIKSFALIIK